MSNVRTAILALALLSVATAACLGDDEPIEEPELERAVILIDPSTALAGPEGAVARVAEKVYLELAPAGAHIDVLVMGDSLESTTWVYSGTVGPQQHGTSGEADFHRDRLQWSNGVAGVAQSAARNIDYRAALLAAQGELSEARRVILIADGLSRDGRLDLALVPLDDPDAVAAELDISLDLRPGTTVSWYGLGASDRGTALGTEAIGDLQQVWRTVLQPADVRYPSLS